MNTYSPAGVVLSIAGIYTVDGYATDSLITLSKNSDNVSTTVGSTGKTERTVNPDNNYTLTVSLAQTSNTNRVFNALATLDNASHRALFPIFAKDNSGNSLFIADTCWVQSIPEISYTDDIETYTWTIFCSGMVNGVGGNDSMNALEQVGQISNLIGQFGRNLGVF